MTLEDALRGPEEAAEQARSIRVDEEYLRHITIVEAMPAHQSGSDKSWVHEAEEALHAHDENAVPVDPSPLGNPS